MTPHAPIARRLGAILAVAATGLLVAACTSTTTGEVKNGSPVAGDNTSSASGASTSGGPTSSAAADPAILHTPRANAVVNPGEPVTVTVTHGTLTSVELTNPEGDKVKGAFNADKTSWATTEDLHYSRTYTLSASGQNADGQVVQHKSSITTITPNNQTMPYIDSLMGQPLVNGATYGVGIIPIVVFDEPIPDRAAAERRLSVTQKNTDGSQTPITGTWYWLDDSHVHWRAPNYLRTGTQVTVSANVYGVNLGNGLFGQADQKVSFVIGDKRVAVADDATHTVSVYFSNKKVMTMPTSMGQGGYTQGTHGAIPLWTMPGTYTVIGHENPAIMSSDSYGLPANSPLGYAPEKVYWSTKISTDGIYLHELDTTVWAQGHSDVSHGCLNLNQANAQWYFTHSRVGDLVQVKNVHTVSGQASAPVALWQGGDWSQSYAALQKMSALH